MGDAGGVEYDTKDRKLGVRDGLLPRPLADVELAMVLLLLLLLLFPNETRDFDI